MMLLYILGGMLLLYILFLDVCALLVNAENECEKIAKQMSFRPTDMYQDALEIFSGENIRKTKTAMIGTSVHRLIEINKEKEDAQWRQDM